ncbi:MAG: ATP-binding protein, partial [Chloroflexota bacterium]
MIHDEADILTLVQGGKQATVDWFKEDTSVDTLAATLGAMANSTGGTLLVGVGPTGLIDGVRNTAATIDTVLEAALKLEPSLIIPMPRIVTINERDTICVQIPAGMPNVYGLDGRYLRRENTTNVGLKPTELRRLIIERGVTSYEGEIVPAAEMDDIDWERARDYARTISSTGDRDVEKILERRGCLARFDGTLRPTNAGLLLFGREPQRHLRGSDITAARFAGNSMGDTFNREDISGTLPDQIRRAETFLADHLRKGVKIGSTMERTEEREYPMEAAREIIVNAVAHRDYSITGDGIRLFLFRDHMEVTSPGNLAGPVTVDNIKDERFSRNPIIVQVLADMGFIEKLGYGVDRVIDLMRSLELPEPEFIETAGGFKVRLHRPEEPTPLPALSSAEEAARVFIADLDVEINPRQEAAVTFLHDRKNKRLTNSDMQSLYPDVHAETLRRDLADLVSKNVLVKMGQKRGSYYVLHTTEHHGD